MTLQLRKDSPACLQNSADAYSPLAFTFTLIGIPPSLEFSNDSNSIMRTNINFGLQREAVKHKILPETKTEACF